MTVGTKSVLYGAHCFFLHPWFVAAAWWKLYGFPWDPRPWVAFFVHDLGYFGKPNMDGPEGERHVEWGARVMTRLFDRLRNDGRPINGEPQDLSQWLVLESGLWLGPWGRFSLFHSRFYVKKFPGARPSRLCVADKLSICITPRWLYLPMVNWTGEIREYMKLAGAGKYETMNIPTSSQIEWFDSVTDYLRRWVDAHRDGGEDTWTPGTAQREAQDATGVWK
jgi:hypothetical protein